MCGQIISTNSDYKILIGAVIAAIVSIIVAVISQICLGRRQKADHEHEKRLKNNELYQNRGEELYKLITKWSENIFFMFLDNSNVIKGKLDLSVAFETVQKLESLDFFRIDMIIEIYYPELNGFYKASRKQLSEINKIYTPVDHNNIIRNNANLQKLADEYSRANSIFEQMVDQLKKELLKSIPK